jgi:exosome complex RNA-binding protein Rrp42 (RNase PH superfamily)
MRRPMSSSWTSIRMLPPDLLLDVSRVPLCVTLTRVGAQQHFVVDATREELACSSGSLAVAVNALGRTCALQKRGHSSLDPATLFTMLHTARSVGAQLIASVDRALADGTQMRADSRGFMN